MSRFFDYLIVFVFAIMLVRCGTGWDLRQTHLVKPAAPPHERYCDEPAPQCGACQQAPQGCILRPAK